MIKAQHIKHLIFDFDCTLSVEHLHGLCRYYVENAAPGKFVHPVVAGKDHQVWNEDEIAVLWKYLTDIKSLLPTGRREDWQLIFNTLISHGYLVSVASFCGFKPIVERFLRDTLELPDAALKKIYRIESWLPKNAETANKNFHLDAILDVTNVNERQDKYRKIILIDDSTLNINAVKEIVSGNHYDSEQNVLLVDSKSARIPQKVIQALSERLGIKFY